MYLNAFDPLGLDTTDGFTLEVVSDAGTTPLWVGCGYLRCLVKRNTRALKNGWIGLVAIPKSDYLPAY